MNPSPMLLTKAWIENDTLYFQGVINGKEDTVIAGKAGEPDADGHVMSLADIETLLVYAEAMLGSRMRHLNLEQLIGVLLSGYIFGGIAMLLCKAWWFLPISAFGLFMFCKSMITYCSEPEEQPDKSKADLHP